MRDKTNFKPHKSAHESTFVLGIGVFSLDSEELFEVFNFIFTLKDMHLL